MTTEPLTADERAELEALRARVAALEAERAEQLGRLQASLAEAQEKVYWLDRWRIDLNALMEKPGAAEFRAEHVVDGGLVGVQPRRRSCWCFPWRWLRCGQGLPHGAPVHPVTAGELADRDLLDPRVPSYRSEQLHT